MKDSRKRSVLILLTQDIRFLKEIYTYPQLFRSLRNQVGFSKAVWVYVALRMHLKRGHRFFSGTIYRVEYRFSGSLLNRQIITRIRPAV